MIDGDAARAIAQAYIAKADGANNLVLLADLTIERDFGWVFFYESKRYLESGNVKDRLVGNSPFIVLREDGNVRVLGTAHPIGWYIETFEKTGRTR